MAPAYRSITAAIEFLTTRDAVRVVRGRERVRYDFRPDGEIVVHAISESDEPRVRRDVVYSLSADFRPREAFVRIDVDGQREGSGWFRFDDGCIRWHADNVRDGASQGVHPIEGSVGAFCAHPVSTDALICAAYARGPSAPRQRLVNVYSSSPDPYGRRGPALTLEQLTLELVGQEPMSTPAGPLPSERYRLSRAEAPDVCLQELWCLEGTGVFLHSRAAGAYATEYILSELVLEPA